MDYIVYTDGGCIRNPGGRGGIGVVILDADRKKISEISEGYESTTNNRMEVTAAIKAMEKISEGKSVLLYSDSQYLVNTMNGAYSRKKNRDLWKRLDQVCMGKKVTWKWVRGHNGDKYNERCDKLASMAMEGETTEDLGYQEKSGKIDIPAGINGQMPECTYTELAEKKNIQVSCAKEICQFYKKKKRTFRDYLELKTGGRDSWSGKKMDAIVEIFGQETVDLVIASLGDDRQAMSALRWHGRGLILCDAIQKVRVDTEVSENCIAAHTKKNQFPDKNP